MALNKPSDPSMKNDFKFATNTPTTALANNPSSTAAMNHNNTRPYSEPPPYGSSRPASTYAPHVSSSTINKFSRGTDKSSPNNGKPYVPLGEIRRNNPVQNRPTHSLGASSYQSLAAFSNQPVTSQLGLRASQKEDEDSEQITSQSEEELSELTAPVLARRLADAQSKLTTQASELKGGWNVSFIDSGEHLP